MKKRILHLLSSNSYSGAENVVCTIINNCNSKYDMYYCSLDGAIKDSLDKRNIRFIPLKRLSILNLRKVVKEYNIDIIHAHDYKASFLAALSGFKGKIISQLHVNWKFNSTWNLYTIAYRLVIKKFYKIVAVSHEILDEAVYVKNNRNRFEVVTNVVDKELVMVGSNEFKSTYYDLIFVGRLTEVKRPEMVIDITNILKDKYPNIRVCIIGRGELEDRLKSLIREYNLEDNIDMLGFLDNPFPYIKASKVAILPSLHEGLPMSVIECMILGVPVLNGGVDGLASLFSKYPDFICDSVFDYVRMIELILDKKKDLSIYCNKIIKDAVDINGYIKRIERLYK